MSTDMMSTAGWWRAKLEYERGRPATTLKDGGTVSRKRFAFVAVGMVAAFAFASPLHAQEAAAGAAKADTAAEVVRWSIITAGFALAIAAAFGALGQSRAIAGAVEGIARNPSAAGEIRGNLILGLVLIESLVIYVLLISLILFFLKPFS
jgi:F-type H+-transporting ATPase subunit c